MILSEVLVLNLPFLFIFAVEDRKNNEIEGKLLLPFIILNLSVLPFSFYMGLVFILSLFLCWLLKLQNADDAVSLLAFAFPVPLLLSLSQFFIRKQDGRKYAFYHDFLIPFVVFASLQVLLLPRIGILQ